MRSPRGGFTLLETMAAFVILAVVTLVILRGVVAATGAGVAAGGVVAAERVARSLVAAPLALTPTARLSGTLDGRAYTVAASPLPFAPAAGVVPARVTISVAAGGGRTVEIETVRLVPAAS